MGFIRGLHAPRVQMFSRDCLDYAETRICFGFRVIELVQADVDEIDDPTMFRGFISQFDTDYWYRRTEDMIRSWYTMDKDLNAVADTWFEAMRLVFERYDMKKALLIAVLQDNMIYHLWELAGENMEEEIAGYIIAYSDPLILIEHIWRSLDEITREAEKICKEKCRYLMYQSYEEYSLCISDCVFDYQEKAIENARPWIGRTVAASYGQTITTNPCIILRQYGHLLPEYEHSQLLQKCSATAMQFYPYTS